MNLPALDATIAVRLLLAGGLGAAVGLERELRGHPAGFRTHILVCLGACLFTVAGLAAPASPGTDYTRIASQVVVGIGFLGGGSIFRHGAGVRGLTTAANLWVTASLGLAVGLGLYLAAAVCAILVLIALSGLKPVERAIVRWRAGKGLASTGEGPEGDE